MQLDDFFIQVDTDGNIIFIRFTHSFHYKDGMYYRSLNRYDDYTIIRWHDGSIGNDVYRYHNWDQWSRKSSVRNTNLCKWINCDIPKLEFEFLKKLSCK